MCCTFPPMRFSPTVRAIWKTPTRWALSCRETACWGSNSTASPTRWQVWLNQPNAENSSISADGVHLFLYCSTCGAQVRFPCADTLNVDIFVARQAIFDRNLNIYAYELLYRSRQTDSFDGLNGSEATLQVITNSFLSMGADKILAGVLGFVNCPQTLLADERIELLPLSTTVIEILESVKPEPAVIAACRRLKDLGYRLALDDFSGQPGYEALIDLADIIKVDFRCLDVAGREAICRQRRRNGTRLLAEKVETRMEFQQALEMGYDYFQGYFFARPETVRGREIGGYRANYIHILKEIHKTEIDRIKVAEHIHRED